MASTETNAQYPDLAHHLDSPTPVGSHPWYSFGLLYQWLAYGVSNK